MELLDYLEPQGFDEGAGLYTTWTGLTKMPGKIYGGFNTMAGGDDIALPKSVLLRDSFAAAGAVQRSGGELEVSKATGERHAAAARRCGCIVSHGGGGGIAVRSFNLSRKVTRTTYR